MTEETTAGSDDGAFYGSKIHHLSYCMAANGQSCSTCQLNFRALKRCWPSTHLPARGTTVRTEIMSSIVYYDEEPMWQNYEQEIGEDDIAFAENQYPKRRTQHKPKTTVPPTVWFPSETGCPDDNISQGTLTQFWKYFVDIYLFSKRAEGSSTPSS